jgi:hypothetical protein
MNGHSSYEMICNRIRLRAFALECRGGIRMKKLILSLVALSLLVPPLMTVVAQPAKADETVIIKKKRHHHDRYWYRHHHRHHDHDRW